MINSFEFENYKSFKKGSINIKPITIFIGGNSSGKSSVTHLPLLFYQTLNNRLANRIQEHRKNLFDINGSVIQMGNTISLIKNKDINNTLSFKFSFKNNFSKKINKITDEFHESIWETVRLYSLLLSQDDQTRKNNSIIKDADILKIALKDHHRWNKNDKKKLTEQLIDKLKIIKEKIDKIEREKNHNKLEELLFLKRYSNNSGRVFANRDEIKSNDDYLWSSNLVDILEKTKEKELIFGFSLKYTEERRSFFVKKIEIIIQENTSNKELIAFEFDSECDLINATSCYINQEAILKYKSSLNKIFNLKKCKSIFDLICKDQFLSNSPLFPRILRSFLNVIFDSFQLSFSESAFNYVGPFREYPKQYYLRAEKIRNSTKISNFMLTEILIDNPDLLKKVNQWLKNFCTEIEIDETNENIRRIKVIRNNLDCDLDISNIGFGISQILPVIIEIILSQPSSITIIEQPELHLHPNMQGMLVDFFIDAIKNPTDLNIEKRLIIETHSSMLLNRLRLRIAQEKIKKDDVAIYTFSVDSNNDGFIKKINLEDRFNFDWPTDFIEEELNDSIELSKIISKEFL